MDTKEAILVDDARNKFIINKDSLLDWDPQDYPANDITSQQAPGGSLNEQALAAFHSGTGHGLDLVELAAAKSNTDLASTDAGAEA